MKKKGWTSDVIKYFIIAILIAVITIFGYGAYSKVREKVCMTDIASFQIELGDIDETIRYGSRMELNGDVPCGADEIYFFDLDKDVPLSLFEELPVIKESLKEKVNKNVFLVKYGEVMGSFYMGDLEVSYPYYSCLKPTSSGKINFFLESYGKKVKLIPGCEQPDCTLIPVNISEERASKVLEEFKNFSCDLCPTNLEYEIGNFRETIKKINIYRRITYCKDTGITKVVIVIKPKEKVEDFYFYEFIPKECVDELEHYLEGIEGGDFSINRSDPLIMWHFDEVKDEEEVSYSLRKELSENCKKIIEGIGIARIIDINEFNSPPEISSTAPTIATLSTLYSYHVVATDFENDQLTYSLEQPVPSGMVIDLNTGWISWTPDSEGIYNIKVIVSDDQSEVSQEFTINVECLNNEIDCSNGIDEDCDGLTDCDDSDCDCSMVEFKCRMDNVETGCVWTFNDECDDHTGGRVTGSCGMTGEKKEYSCYDELWSGCGIAYCGSGYKTDERVC